MCIVESMLTFYHGTQTNLPIGTILVAQPEGYVNHPDADEAHLRLEEELERLRPSNAPSRVASVYMVTDPHDIDSAGGYEDHIYVVDPMGSVWKCNMAWYSDLYGMLWDNVEVSVIEEYAHNYWNAVPQGPSDLYEYLAKSAKVEREIDI